MPELRDTAVAKLTCAAPGCTRWVTAQRAHLANLLARGKWHCPDHRDDSKEPA